MDNSLEDGSQTLGKRGEPVGRSDRPWGRGAYGRPITPHAGFRFHSILATSHSAIAFGFGHAGVDFFFVLSGFIIMHAHTADIGKPERLYRYLWRRATRIYPIYWIVTLIQASRAFFSADFAIRLAPSHIVHSLLLLPETNRTTRWRRLDPTIRDTVLHWFLRWPFSTGACASRLSLLR